MGGDVCDVCERTPREDHLLWCPRRLVVKKAKVIWTYRDPRGIRRTGEYLAHHFFDDGDVVYQFRRLNGVIDVVSGRELKDVEVSVHEARDNEQTEAYEEEGGEA